MRYGRQQPTTENTSDASSSDQTYTLPQITSTNDGSLYRIGKTGANALTISAYSGDDIADTTSTLTSVNHTDSYVTLMADNTNSTWRIISNSGDWKYSSRTTFPQSINGDVQYYDATVNFTTSDSTSDIQAKIDACPKRAYDDAVLTFQFADGSYSITTISFNNFKQEVRIYGNSSDNSASFSKNVEMSFADNNGFVVNQCVNTIIKYIKVTTSGTSSDRIGIFAENCLAINIVYCALSGSSTSYDIGCEFSVTDGIINTCVFGNNRVGILSTNSSSILSASNSSDTTDSTYGIQARNNGEIGKSGSQPTGTTANEYYDNGGEIR